MMKNNCLKRVLAALMCAVMALSVLPANLFSVYAADLITGPIASEDLWQLYGTQDTTTKGAWNTAGYGSYDAVLLGYGYTGEVLAGERKTFQANQYANNAVFAPNSRVSVSWPYSNEHYTFGTTGEEGKNPSEEILYNPNSAVTNVFDVYYNAAFDSSHFAATKVPGVETLGNSADGWKRTYFTFSGLEEDQEYLFRIYSNNNLGNYYRADVQDDLKFHFVEDDGTVHKDTEGFQSHSFDDGVYRTYKVKGNFTLVVDKKVTRINGNADTATTASYWGPSGFFFDEYEPVDETLWQQYGDIDTTTHGAWQTKGYGEKQAILLGWNKAADMNASMSTVDTSGTFHRYHRVGINPMGASWHKDTSENAISMIVDSTIHGYMGGNMHVYRAADKMGFATNKVYLETPEGYTGTVPVYNSYTSNGKAASEAPFKDVCPVSEGMGSRMTMKFTVPDGDVYAFRIYADTRNYKYKVNDTVVFHFLSEDGTKHLSSTEVSCADFDKDGAYITFKVQGSFWLLMDKKHTDDEGLNNSAYFGMSAFFFDDVTEAESFEIEENKAEAFYLYTDTTTTGANWQNVYGNIDAVLLGYKYTEAFSSVISMPRETYDYIHNNSVRIRFEGDKWRVYPATGEDVLYNPNKEVTQTFNVFTGGGASTTLHGGMFPRPDGYVRNTFQFNDLPEDMYQFTIYGNNDASMFAQENVGTVILTFVDEDGNVVLQDTITTDIFDEHAYRSYMLEGNFTLLVDKDTNAQHFGFNGFFFTEPAENFVSNLSATEGSAARSVQLTWTEINAPSGAVITLQRSANGGEWEDVAEITAGTKSYLDTNLRSGTTYQYRMYVRSGAVCSEMIESTSVTTVKYTETVLTPDAKEYSCKDNETTMTVKATLTLADGTPCAGLPVYLNIQYAYHSQTVPAVLTDENGVATFSFIPKYQGNAAMTVHFDDDDTLEYSYFVTDKIPVLVGETNWAYSPVIYKITDALSPGSVGSINGYGFCNEDMSLVQVRYAPHYGTPNATPTSDARVMPLVQTDEEGFYISFKLPVTATPGLYDVWVNNGYGWSEPIVLNAPRPLFMSEYEAWEGQTLQISGRCLQADQFGGQTETRVRLVSDSKTYNVELTKVTPYSLAFVVGEGTALGTYEVEISNDGGCTWVKPESGQTLTVVKKGNDPLNTGLAWMDDFNWDNEYDVTQKYGGWNIMGSMIGQKDGANGSDTKDDTAAFEHYISEAASNGGGVVYIPKGTYYIKGLAIPSGVVLMGENMNETVLVYSSNANKSNMFYSDVSKVTAQKPFEGLQGFANFTVDMQDPSVRPDFFFRLGHTTDTTTSTQTNKRNASRIFLKHINWDYGRVPNETAARRGIGLGVVAKERLLVEYCQSDSYWATLAYNKQNEYAIIRHNVFKYDTGNIYCNANYAFIENNYVSGRLDEITSGKVEDSSITDSRNSHGICVQGGAHLENNIVENMGANISGDVSNIQNDGETYLCELASDTPIYGEVLASTPNTFTLRPVGGVLVELGVNPIAFNYLAAVIHAGRGMGQYAKVTHIDPETGVVTIEGEWAVQPDYTSKIGLIVISDRTTFYNNIDRNSAKGVYIYGNMYDTVVANHQGEDTEGVLIVGSQSSGSNYRIWNNFYITVRDSYFEGVSPRSQHCNIAASSTRAINGSKFYCVNNYGIEIRGNTIVGDPDANPVYKDENGNYIRRTESPQFDGIYVATNKNSDNVSGDNMDVIVEDNCLVDLEKGILYSKSEKGLIIENNATKNVETPIYHDLTKQTDQTAIPQKVLISDDTMTAEKLHRYAQTWEHYDEDTYCNSRALADAVEAALAMDNTTSHYEMNQAMAAIRNAVYGIEVHAWDEGTVTQQPTVDEYGIKTYTCESCGDTKTSKIAKLSVGTWQQIGSMDNNTGKYWATKGYGEVQAILPGWAFATGGTGGNNGIPNNGVLNKDESSECYAHYYDTEIDRYANHMLYGNKESSIKIDLTHMPGRLRAFPGTSEAGSDRLSNHLEAPKGYAGVIPQYNLYATDGYSASTPDLIFSTVVALTTNYRQAYQFNGLDANKEYAFTIYSDSKMLKPGKDCDAVLYFANKEMTEQYGSAYTIKASDFGQNGGYLTFKVSGVSSFSLVVDKKSNRWGPAAFFFDECSLPDELTTDKCWDYCGSDTTTKGAWNTAGYGSYDAVLIGYNYNGALGDAGKRVTFNGNAYTNNGVYCVNNKVGVTLSNTSAHSYAFKVTDESGTNPPSETLYNPNTAITTAFDSYYMGGTNKNIPGAKDLPALLVDTCTLGDECTGGVCTGETSWTRHFFTFTGLEEGQHYLFRIYTNNNVSGYYKAQAQEDLKFHFVEADGTVHSNLECIQSKSFDGGVYRTYLVEGNFTLIVDKKETRIDGHKEGTRSAGYFGLSGFFFDKCDVAVDKVEYAKISLDGTIGMSLGANLNVAAKRDAGAAMILSQKGKDDVAVKVSDSQWKDKLNWFSRGVAAKEMTDVITCQMYYSNGLVGAEEYKYSVEEYARQVLASEQSEVLKDLIKAMLNYGGHCQTYFGYNESQMANRTLTTEDRWTSIRQLTAEELKPYFDMVDGGSSAARLSEASLLLKSGTTLRLSFLDSVAEGKTFKHNGEVLKVTNRTGKYSYVDIDNIAAARLGDVFAVEVYEGDKLVSTVKYCPIAYGYAALTQSDDPDLHNTVKSLYLYYKAADAYFNG